MLRWVAGGQSKTCWDRCQRKQERVRSQNPTLAPCCYTETQTQHTNIHPRKTLSHTLTASPSSHFCMTHFQTSSREISGVRPLRVRLRSPAGGLLLPRHEGPALPGLSYSLVNTKAHFSWQLKIKDHNQCPWLLTNFNQAPQSFPRNAGPQKWGHFLGGKAIFIIIKWHLHQPIKTHGNALVWLWKHKAII